jgi:YHS domain-containing protein
MRPWEVRGWSSLAVDPVCGMNVEERTSRFKVEFGGKAYYFCSRVCQERFEADPDKYAR